MVDLDNKVDVIKSQGGENVIKSIDALDKQLSQSFNETLNIKFPIEYKNAKNAVICGMGGSRFPSIIINKLFKDKFKIPYEVVDNYTLPGYADDKTLVIASSYSGTTEEVLACANDAIDKGAMLTGITTGGDLADIFDKKDLRYYKFDPKFNPSNQPRIGFGYMVGGHLGLLINLGYIKESDKVINTAINNLKTLTKNLTLDTPVSQNPAKKMAQELLEKYPFFIVSDFLTGVGNAIANQVNETAKTISSFRVVPELNHHLMEGLKHPAILKDLAVFVFFYSDLFSESITKRFNITKEVIEKNLISTLWYDLQGRNKIEQTFELMAFGSYLSMYLAALRNEDPTVIPYVDYFKEQIKQ
jgi:glucose/mannose-6-phosphate isomerase